MSSATGYVGIGLKVSEEVAERIGSTQQLRGIMGAPPYELPYSNQSFSEWVQRTAQYQPPVELVSGYGTAVWVLYSTLALAKGDWYEAAEVPVWSQDHVLRARDSLLKFCKVAGIEASGTEIRLYLLTDYS